MVKTKGIIMPKTEAGALAAETIINILESYMEFVSTIDFYAKNFAEGRPKMLLKAMCKRRFESWLPMLEQIKSDLEKEKQCQ